MDDLKTIKTRDLLPPGHHSTDAIDQHQALQRRRLLWAAAACMVAGVIAIGVSQVWLRWSLLHGPFPMLVEVAGLTFFASSVVRRNRNWWTRWLPAVVIGSTIVAFVIAKLLRSTQMVTENYPRSFLAWVAATVLALIAAPIAFRQATMRMRAIRIAAVPLMIVTSFIVMNSHYGYWPTIGDLLGSHLPGQISAQTLQAELAAGGMPSTGQVAIFDAAPTVSQFRHRAGYIYLPPAFFNHSHDQFPVLIMLGGEPGAPSDWLRAGRAAQTANAYALSHHGEGAVMIFVDHNGGPTRDTECVDGPRGRSETYISTDVPRAAIQKFGLTNDPARWGIVGFSEGGTCAFVGALRHPNMFGHFVDLAGDDAPRLWDFQSTLKYLFGGDTAKMNSYDTGRILRWYRFRGMTGWFGAGKDDSWDVQHMRWEANAATHSGIPSHVVLVPSQAHSWTFGATAFEKLFVGLLDQMGLKPNGSVVQPPFPMVFPTGSPTASPAPKPKQKQKPKHKNQTHPAQTASPSPAPSPRPSPSQTPSPLL